MGGPVMGPMGHVLKSKFASMFGGRKAVFFVAKFNSDDMQTLRELLEAGTVAPVIDRRYPLSDVAEAFRYLGEGHAQGKVVCSGPFVPREGGAMLLRVEHPSEIEPLLAKDPFRQENLVSNTIYVWDVNIGRDGLDTLARPG